MTIHNNYEDQLTKFFVGFDHRQVKSAIQFAEEKEGIAGVIKLAKAAVLSNVKTQAVFNLVKECLKELENKNLKKSYQNEIKKIAQFYDKLKQKGEVVVQINEMDAVSHVAHKYQLPVNSWYSKQNKNSLVEHVQSLVNTKIQQLLDEAAIDEAASMRADLEVVEAAKGGPGILPNLLVGMIASYLPVTDASSLLPHLAATLGTTVSHTMREEAYKGKDQERGDMAIIEFIEKTTTEIQLEGPLPSFTSFRVTDHFAQPEVLQFLIKNCLNLQKVSFSRCWKPETTSQFLPKFPQLRHLDITDSEGTQLDLSVFAQLPEIESLSFKEFSIAPAALDALKSLKEVKRLRLERVVLIDDPQQNPLASWDQLALWNQLDTLDINLQDFQTDVYYNRAITIRSSLSECSKLSCLRLTRFPSVHLVNPEILMENLYLKMQRLPGLTRLEVDMRFFNRTTPLHIDGLVEAVIVMTQLQTIHFCARKEWDNSVSEAEKVLTQVQQKLKQQRPELVVELHIGRFHQEHIWEDAFYTGFQKSRP